MRKRRVLVGIAGIVGLLIVAGCATMPPPDEARFKADLVGTWVNPEYEEGDMFAYPIIEIRPDLTMTQYRQDDPMPAVIRMTFVKGRVDRDGNSHYTLDAAASWGAGFVVFKLHPDQTLEFVYACNLQPGWDYPEEVDPDAGIYGIYTRK